MSKTECLSYSGIDELSSDLIGLIVGVELDHSRKESKKRIEKIKVKVNTDDLMQMR